MKNVTVIIGAPNVPEKLVYELTSRLVLITGGLTLYNAVGYWSPDGSETKSNYAEAEKEPALRVTFTIEAEKLEEKREEIKDTVRLAVLNSSTEADWVHLQEESVEVSHFQVTLQ